MIPDFTEVRRNCSCGRSLNTDGRTCREHGLQRRIIVVGDLDPEPWSPAQQLLRDMGYHELADSLPQEGE